VLHRRWRWALRSRPAGGGSKPPQAAPVKSRGGERPWKRRNGMRQVRAKKANASEPLMTCRKRRDDIKTEAESLPWEEAWGQPAYCPGGVRHEGGASLAQAPVWNVGTCRPIARLASGARRGQQREGEPQAAGTARGRVPMRATGTDRPVVVRKPGNAGGAKGAGYPGLVGGQPRSGRNR
jgi:hypothetical protein